MLRAVLISTLLFPLLPPSKAQTGRQDYIGELRKLTDLTDQNRFREAITGYEALESRAGTPRWLKAAAEYEIAELRAALRESEEAVAALGRAAQLGYDDCLAPRTSERLAPVLKSPKATEALAGMNIPESDFRELFWLRSEVQHADHDARMMITENINRVDHQATEIPQAQIPTRPTTSPAVLYWRQQLLLIQQAQREFVRKSDEQRMAHVAKMAIIAGGANQSAVLQSARLANAAAESRKAEIRKRAFVPLASWSDQPKACSEWK